jgi:hypothetical protein
MKRTRLLLSALLVGATTVVLSCGEPSPLAIAPRGAGLHANLLDSLLHIVRSQAQGLVRCTPLPYDSVTKTIGPAGDTIQVGPHTLRVPAGALDSAVSITAVAPSDTVNRVDFQPEGLVFRQPASVVMSYANCGVQNPPNQPAEAGPAPLNGPSPKAVDAVTKALAKTSNVGAKAQADSVSAMQHTLRIAYITDSLQIISYLESVDDTTTQRVTGRLDHFSDYALAW